MKVIAEGSKTPPCATVGPNSMVESKPLPLLSQVRRGGGVNLQCTVQGTREPDKTQWPRPGRSPSPAHSRAEISDTCHSVARGLEPPGGPYTALRLAQRDTCRAAGKSSKLLDHPPLTKGMSMQSETHRECLCLGFEMNDLKCE